MHARARGGGLARRCTRTRVAAAASRAVGVHAARAPPPTLLLALLRRVPVRLGLGLRPWPQVGLLPELRAFAAASRAVLAVSLHATTDEVRDWVCPINRR